MAGHGEGCLTAPGQAEWARMLGQAKQILGLGYQMSWTDPTLPCATMLVGWTQDEVFEPSEPRYRGLPGPSQRVADQCWEAGNLDRRPWEEWSMRPRPGVPSVPRAPKNAQSVRSRRTRLSLGRTSCLYSSDYIQLSPSDFRGRSH